MRAAELGDGSDARGARGAQPGGVAVGGRRERRHHGGRRRRGAAEAAEEAAVGDRHVVDGGGRMPRELFVPVAADAEEGVDAREQRRLRTRRAAEVTFGSPATPFSVTGASKPASWERSSP